MNTNNKIYTGSGILPIYVYNNIPYFVIIKLNNGIYTDPGGKLEPKITLLDNASKELYEETAGLIKLDNKKIRSNFIKNDTKYNKNKYYRSHIVIIDSQLNLQSYSKLYEKNLEKCNKFRFNPFSETIQIKFIKLSTINYDILKKNLHPRLKLIIVSLLKKYENMINFYNKIKYIIKPLYLEKIITNPISYEYNYNKKINITNLSTFVISNNNND